MEPSDLGPERAMRQYLAHLLESGGGCTRSVGCLDRFLVKGMNNFPPPPPPQPPSSSSLSLEAKASRCSLFEQLLNGGRRRQERLLVPDLATNWFRKQKLSPEELAAISKDLAHEDEECSCLEAKKSQEWRRQPSKQRSKHCRPICRCSEAALAPGTKDSLEEPVARPVSECLPTTEPKSRNPFLLNTETMEERRSKSLLRPRKLLWESNSYTPQRRSCSCLKPQRARASCSCCCSDSMAARRTESMLPRLRCKFDLRQAPQRRLDPAHFRRISPEFFRILATYEEAMSEICPLYGISMHHWGETKECCPCEEPPPGAWQEQHFLGDDSVATARVSPCRLPGLERWKEKQEKERKEEKERDKKREEKREREKEREKKEKGQKEKGQKEEEQKEEREQQQEKAGKKRGRQHKEEDKEENQEKENKNQDKRRVRTSSSSEPALRQKQPGKRTCNNDTCPARRNQDKEHRHPRSTASSSYSCARCAGEEEERQSQRRSKQSFQSTATSERSRREQEREQEQQQRERNSKQEEQQRSRNSKEEERQQQQQQWLKTNREEDQQRQRTSKEVEQQPWRRNSKKEQPQERQQETKPPPPQKPPKKRRTLRDCFRGAPNQQYKTACFPCSPGSCPPPPPPTAPSLGSMYPGCRPLHCPNQPKGILNGFTGMCKRHLLYNLGANTHPNREKYAQMQQDKQRLKRLRGRGRERPERERERLPPPEMCQASTPYIFSSEPAPCCWQKLEKHLDLPEMEMQPEDSSTTLKPYITCREERQQEERQQEERQQEELQDPWPSDESLIFRTPDSERTLAGANQPPEESVTTQCGCPRIQSETSWTLAPPRSINCRCGQPQETFQLPPIYRSGTGTATVHSQEAPSIQGGQEVAFESKKPEREKPAKEKPEKEKPAKEKREAIPRKASTEEDYTRCGYRPRACYLANDYHQLMRRVARRRPSRERQKRRKPQKPPSRSASKTTQKEKPKEVPKKAPVAPPKPKPKPKTKPKLKPKPRTPSPVCQPLQSSSRSLNPQVRWRHIVKRKKENRARKTRSLPEVPESQSSTRSLTICQAQSDIPSARSQCQSQSETCQRSSLPQSSSLAFVSCHCADEEMIPSRSTSQKPSCLCQSMPVQEAERVLSCQAVEQPLKQEPYPSQEPCPPENPFPQENRNPLVRRSRSPTPQCKRKQRSFQTPRRSPVPKKKPSPKRPPSCGSCSSARTRHERSSSQSEASNCRCPRKETPKRRPQPSQNYQSLCYRQRQGSFTTETTNRSQETSLASSTWSQPQPQQLRSPRRGSSSRYGEQSFQTNASYPSCWHHQPLSSNVSSLQDAYTSQESSRAPLRSAMRRRGPIQWLPPEMSEADSPSQESSLYTQLETGRRYYTDTQLGQATRHQCSCRSLHSSCSIRALSSNTDSVRCPCAPAPSIASVEPEPPLGAVEEQQQQYYHYQEPEPEPSYLQESPPPAACACSQSCQCKRLKIFSHKPAILKDTLPWEEQEHRHARTTLTTQRPPPRTRRRENCFGGDLPRRKERLPEYRNACYYPDVNYKSWRQDQHCQATMQATSLEESQRYAQPYAVPLEESQRYPPPYALPLCQQGQYFGQGRDQVGGAGAGAIAAAAQGLRGLVKALGGARNRGRRPDTDGFTQELVYPQETMDFAQDSGFQGGETMESGIMPLEGTSRETAFPSRTTNSFLSSSCQSYSTNSESNYQYQSLPSTSCYGSAESERFYARLAAGRGRAKGGKPAREGKRGTTASGALVSFASGLDFSSKKERETSKALLEKEEQEEEPEPTPLAIFLDNLRAKHAASQILERSTTQEARKKEPKVIALQNTSSSEDFADADDSLETKELTLHRESGGGTLVFPATYTGLLEEQIIDEYLPRPRYKRRK